MCLGVRDDFTVLYTMFVVNGSVFRLHGESFREGCKSLPQRITGISQKGWVSQHFSPLYRKPLLGGRIERERSLHGVNYRIPK